MTSFLLKIIGIITMLFDHVGDSIVGKFSFFNLIGRISFPIFAFQTVEGYIHTKNLKKHILKMFIFACISQIPFSLFLSTFTQSNYLNIFFSLTLGLIALVLYDKCKNKFLGFLGVLYGDHFSCSIASRNHSNDICLQTRYGRKRTYRPIARLIWFWYAFLYSGQHFGGSLYWFS